MYGYIHSIETMGTVDGPGLRYVIFTSGCPLRCKYCHNPDTWNIKSGEKRSVTELLDDFESYRPFLTNGGITVTGGEPLIQLDFITELFKEAKSRKIHTCLDTSGTTFNKTPTKLSKFNTLVQYTDLVLLDIKHISPNSYYALTKGNLNSTLDFLDFLAQHKIAVIIRHVIVKNITYKAKYLYRLGYHLGQYKNINAIDILPYHNMGEKKYEELNIPYPLKGSEEMTKEHAIKAKKIVYDGIRDNLLKIKPKF